MRTLLTSFLLSAALSMSAPLTYNSLSGWQAAGTQTGTVTFEDRTPGQYTYLPYFSSLFTFYDTSGAGLYVTDPTATPRANLTTGQAVLGPAGPTYALGINIPTGLYGFGFNLASNLSSTSQTSAVTITVGLQGGSTVTYSVTPAALASAVSFWGIRNDVPITSITVSADTFNYRPIIDNATWSTDPPTEAPEASTAVLIGATLILLPTLRRRFLNQLPQQHNAAL